jgi:hypothetical protein
MPEQKTIRDIIYWHSCRICNLEEMGCEDEEERIKIVNQIYDETLSEISALIDEATDGCNQTQAEIRQRLKEIFKKEEK